MSDEMNEAAPADNAATLCSALIILTSVMLIAAIVVVNSVNATHYGKGWF